MPRHDESIGTNILDSIKEQTTNIESFTNSRTISIAIDKALRESAIKERATRDSTITIRNTEELNFQLISNLIDTEWVTGQHKAPISYWQDKLHTYAQFINKDNKLEFVAATQDTRSNLNKLKGLLIRPNNNGQQLTRKEVRLEITGVRNNIKANQIEDLLKRLSGPNTNITGFKEGKPYGPQGNQRCIMFKVNAEAFKVIFGQLQGSLPYSNSTTNTKIKLYPKLNCRPWSCRDCLYIGPKHECTGRLCGNCGNKNHTTKECASKTRFCSNCKRQGHRARDAHCPIYLKEVIKEIKRMDIPVEFFEDKEKRFTLIQALNYK